MNPLRQRHDDRHHWNSNSSSILPAGKGLGLEARPAPGLQPPAFKEDYSLSDADEWRSLCGKPKDGKARLEQRLRDHVAKDGDRYAEQFAQSRSARRAR